MAYPAWFEIRSDETVKIHLRLQPRASKNEVLEPDAAGQRLRIRLTAPPVDNAANSALIKFLAAEWGVRRSGIRIVAGQKSRSKTLLIETSAPASLWERVRRS